MGIVSIKRIYECDNCKKQSEWDDSWKHKTVFHMKGMWDETITVCSEKCANEIDNKRNKRNKERNRKNENILCCTEQR